MPVNKLKPLVIIIFLILLISCNLIISNPHTRENPNDPDAEISKFYAFAVDTDEIITTWQWNDNNHDSDERIEEILLLHSPDDYPEVLIPFTGESITNSSKSEFKWKDLDKNTTHYFALHMKDERDRWYAPLFAKATLPGSSVTGNLSISNAWEVDNMMTGSPVVTTAILSGLEVLVIELVIPKGIYIISAYINPINTIGIQTSNLEALNIYPLTDKFDNFDTGDHAWIQLSDQGNHEYLVDDSIFNGIPGQNGSWNSTPIDVTEAVIAAMQYGSDQLVIKIVNTAMNSTVDVIYSDFLEIEYLTN